MAEPFLRLPAALLLGALAAAAHAAEIDLTRYVQHHVLDTVAPAAQMQLRFFGAPGDARLTVQRSDPAVTVSIVLNGAEVTLRPAPDGITVDLVEDNRIQYTVEGSPGATATVRVKQQADIKLNVVSRVHFNTNVSDFGRSRAFYTRLGFETVSGFPDTNTVEMAQAIGIQTPTRYDGAQGDWAGGYLLHGELIGLGGFGGGVIDLIEFTIPRSEAPPYARLNHLGMARAVILTSSVDSDYAHLYTSGVEFLSPPATRADGTRFAVFRDPDGTFYELAQKPGETREPEAGRAVQTYALGPLNVNVSDFERSRAWYEMLGYEVSRQLPASESAEVANAMGFTAPFEITGALLTHPTDGSQLELVQWLSPSDTAPPYPLPVNHLGIHRTAFLTTDIEADVATLKGQGVEFVSPITPCCSGPDSWGSIVAFFDPDGTIVELVEQPGMGPVMSIIGWFRSWFE